MPTLIVKTPCAGKITNLDPGICSAHSACVAGAGSLTDYGSVSGITALSLKTNALSAYFEVSNSCCSSSPVSVKVSLYAFTDRGCPIGWILYGHLANVPAGLNRLLKNYPNDTFIGNPATCCTSSCWSETHVHMEIGSLYATSWGRYSFTCQQSLPAGQSIFYWNYNTCPT